MKISPKVIVGISGGVDSSVAAYLLQQEGFAVEGLFMKNWEEDDSSEHCSAEEDLKFAKAACDALNIKLHTVNFAAEYWDNVFEYFLAEFKKGRTPNPDILCNSEIKFKVFLQYAKHLGADYIATGHYAGKKDCGDHVELHKALDDNKDQTYFLHALSQAQLKDVLFPLANLTKPEIREIAKALSLPNCDKKDSTGICFIGERKFKDFLQQFLPAQQGDIQTLDGTKIGQHDGLMFYTLGQRQGLKIGGLKDAGGEPWYVVDKDLDNNVLIVAQGTNHPALYAPGLIAERLSWIHEPPMADKTYHAKIRYRQKDQPCTISLEKNEATIIFEEKQRAITPGQFVVLYDGNICLGGGIIKTTLKDKTR